jgi:hypothetical protein
VFEGTGQLYGASEVEATGIVGVVTLVELAAGPQVAGSPPSTGVAAGASVVGATGVGVAAGVSVVGATGVVVSLLIPFCASMISL